MKTIRVKRLELEENTLSRIFVPTLYKGSGIQTAKFCGLELPNRHNQVNQSCVPYGTFKAFTRLSPSRNYIVLELKKVPERTNCQFHIGTTKHHTLGCVLVGDGFAKIDADDNLDVTNSKQAYEEFIRCVCDGAPYEGYECLVEFYK